MGETPFHLLHHTLFESFQVLSRFVQLMLGKKHIQYLHYILLHYFDVALSYRQLFTIVFCGIYLLSIQPILLSTGSRPRLMCPSGFQKRLPHHPLQGGYHKVCHTWRSQQRSCPRHRSIFWTNRSPVADIKKINHYQSSWGFPEIEVPPVIIHFNGIFPYKPSIWGYPIYGNPHLC